MNGAMIVKDNIDLGFTAAAPSNWTEVLVLNPDAVRPLGDIRARRLRVRPVSHVRLRLLDRDAFDRAIRESVAWLSRRAHASIPESAFRGEPFSTSGRAGANPAETVRVQESGAQYWALRLAYPDESVPQRDWVSEIVICRSNGVVDAEIRLTNVTKGEDAPYTPTIPGLASQLLSRFSAELDRRHISEQPWSVGPHDSSELLDFLKDSKRESPIVAVSSDAREPSAELAASISKRLAASAHIVVLNSDTSWILTNTFGKLNSVFHGGIRIYWSGFGLVGDSPYRHRLWLGGSWLSSDELLDDLSNEVLPKSVGADTRRFTLPRFEQLRAEAAATVITPAASTGTDLVAEMRSQISRLEQENAKLRSGGDEDRAALDQLLLESVERQATVEAERDAAYREAIGLRYRIRTLESATALSSGKSIEDEPLREMAEIEQWAAQHLGGRIVLLPRAIRETESYPFEDPKKFGEALLLIRDYYVPMRRGEIEREKYQEALRQAQLYESLCFDDRSSIKGFPEYRINYKGRPHWMERHFKYRTGYDPTNMFRLYYIWDEEEQVVVVGHMPSHLDNKKTN